ncbi:MFS transporter [Leucobacter weissii]|uniref:MFS transporter n=1 Tax=Leucobacter weissii TaxID=1983706 RepID=A0A939SCX3_9MICO|nr:MFS transporter [Leucobacter weissii]MBO1902875.1 MFS transporter [Leucobacter weissii]
MTAAAPTGGWRTFLHVLVNTAVAGLTTNFLWFAVVFWVYLETRSILATGILSGVYMILVALSSMWFGSLVDRYRKRSVMLVSAWLSLIAFAVGCAVFFTVPADALLALNRPWFWLFTLVLLAGCVVEMLRALALSTTVTLLVPVEQHANANGLVGTVQGLTFIVTSVFSGLSIGFFGMGATMLIALALTAIPILHLHLLRIPEQRIVADPERSAVDFRGGWAAMLAVPGLLALVIFSTFNNLGGGVYMALLDPYGLTMFPVEIWGVAFGLAGTGFIVGGALVAKWGLGRNPVRTMLILVAALGLLGSSITLREWPWLFIGGIWVFMLLMPAIEAAEQTVIQRVVPFEKQGRVFGLAMTFEASAAPITAFLIAPIAEFWVVPYMETAQGRERWGWLLGEGESRGIALIFLVAGVTLALLAVAAMFTGAYRRLSRSFAEAMPVADSGRES